MNFKEVLGIIATGIALLGYIPYFIDIFKNKTKPHAFSWLIWGILTGIGFLAQVSGGAGPGAWVTGITALVCFVIFILGWVKGRKNIVLFDWFCLLGAGIAIVFWLSTKGPLLSVILITFIDMIGVIPTLRKSLKKPEEETLITYFLSGLKFVLAVFALNSFSVITALYPFSLIVTNWIFVGMLIIRRKQVRTNRKITHQALHTD